MNNDAVIIERRIAQKRELMEKKKNEFNDHIRDANDTERKLNYHNAEAKRLQRVVENLWNEIESDKRKLQNMKAPATIQK